jgi:hypothetical protein
MNILIILLVALGILIFGIERHLRHLRGTAEKISDQLDKVNEQLYEIIALTR